MGCLICGKPDIGTLVSQPKLYHDQDRLSGPVGQLDMCFAMAPYLTEGDVIESDLKAKSIQNELSVVRTRLDE